MSLLRVSVTHPAPRSFLSKLGVSVTLFAAAAVAGALLTLTGCKESDADKIGDAQACLDKYSQNGGGDLSVCEAYVADLTTPAAHGIRCASGYIREGFDSAQSFIDAFTAIETISPANVADFLIALAFDNVPINGTAVPVDGNYAAAQAVNSSCSLSLAKGATLISTFSFMTNILYKYSCDGVPAGPPFEGNCNQTKPGLEGALAYEFLGLAPMSAARTAMRVDLGTIVVNANTVSCLSGATNEKLCEFLQTAINNAGGPNNKEQVGKEFLNVLANPPP